MATDLENLNTALTNLYIELASAPARRSYSIDGQSVERYSRSDILKQIKEIREAIAALEGPIELHSELWP